MRIELVSVGTELLLGQIADTNAAWLGTELALAGVDSHYHQAVGDNQERIVLALRTALARSDGVVVCGGLGPTHDDITRQAIAAVMNVALVEDAEIADRIADLFAKRGRTMSPSNLRQAQVPVGAVAIEQRLGTAPGFICLVGLKVVYALPGVPHQIKEMFTWGVLPDLGRRIHKEGGDRTILSRVVRTWGITESALGERLAERIGELDAQGGNPTIALLASGIEGIKVRVTASAPDGIAAKGILDSEEAYLRSLLGNLVFGTDDETMETAVASQLTKSGLTLAVAESRTGGLISSRLVGVEGASAWFTGSVVSYRTSVKTSLLGVGSGPVVSGRASCEMAEGVRTLLSSDIGLSVTGVAGPTEQDGKPPGTVFVGLALPGSPAFAAELQLFGDRERVRQYCVISALDLLRRNLAGNHDDDPATGLITSTAVGPVSGSSPGNGVGVDLTS